MQIRLVRHTRFVIRPILEGEPHIFEFNPALVEQVPNRLAQTGNVEIRQLVRRHVLKIV